MAETRSQPRLPRSDRPETGPALNGLTPGGPGEGRTDRRAAVAADGKPALSAGDFHGGWDVRRTVIDHLSGAVHRFAGTAIIGACDFVETGDVRYGDVCLKAERRYVLRATDDGIGNDAAHDIVAGIAIAFADGRPFISLGQQASQAVHHLCGADDYHGRFFFRSRDAWAEAWRVTGPRKRYASLTQYRRQGV